MNLGEVFMKRYILFLVVGIFFACQSPFSRPEHNESIKVNLSIPAVDGLGGNGSRLISSYSSILLIELITPDGNIIRQYADLEPGPLGYFEGAVTFEDLKAKLNYTIRAEARSISNEVLHLGTTNFFLGNEDQIVDLKLHPHPASVYTSSSGYRQVFRGFTVPSGGFRFFEIDNVPELNEYIFQYPPPVPSTVDLYIQDGQGNILFNTLDTPLSGTMTFPGPAAGSRLYVSAYDNSASFTDLSFAVSDSSHPADFDPPNMTISAQNAQLMGNFIRVDMQYDVPNSDMDRVVIDRFDGPNFLYSVELPAPADGIIQWDDYDLQLGGDYSYRFSGVDQFGNSDPPSLFTNTVSLVAPNINFNMVNYDPMTKNLTLFMDDDSLPGPTGVEFILSRSLNNGPMVEIYSGFDGSTPFSFPDTIDFLTPPQAVRYQLEAISPFGVQTITTDTVGKLLQMDFQGDLYQDIGPYAYRAQGLGFSSQDRFGNPNSAVSFNGTNTMELTDSSQILDPGSYGQQLSISFWLALDDFSSTQGIFQMVDNSTPSPRGLRLHYEAGGDLVLTVNEMESATIPFYHTLASPGQWKLITIAFDATTADLTVDGGTNATAFPTSPITFSGDEPLYLGSAPRLGGDTLRGKIDDFRIYSYRFYDDASPATPDDLSQIFSEGGWPAPELMSFNLSPGMVDFDFHFSGRPDFIDWYVRLDREISPGIFTFEDEGSFISMPMFTLTPGTNYRISAWERNSVGDRISLIRQFTFGGPPNDALAAHWRFEPGSETYEEVDNSLGELVNMGNPMTPVPNRFGAPGSAQSYDTFQWQRTAAMSPNLDVPDTGMSWSFWMRTNVDTLTDNG
jgi:hypothetical protein